jgi:hypothetical protein
MRVVTGRRQCEALALLAFFCVSMSACRSDAVAPRGGVPPIDQMTNLGTTIVDVNLKTGEVTTHPLESGASTAKGVDARFFGAPNTITHVFTLEGGAPSASHVFTLDDHIENAFSFPIGTHLPHATGVFPEDTMGVYVFVSIAPTVTAGCTPGPGCTVVDSGDGSFPFTSGTLQPYMFFKTILEAADGTPHHGLDFTDQSPANGGTGINYFRSLAFHATSGVTNFKFGVSASAAAVKPNDVRWKVTYVADSLPNRVGTGLTDLRSEPDWRVHASATAVTDTSIQTSGCTTGFSRCFQIISHTPASSGITDSISYFRSDSLGTTDSAFIAADVVMANLTPNVPSIFLGMQDRARGMLLGFSSNKVGFCDASGNYLSGAAAAMAFTGTSTSWRISKFGADSVVVYNGGTKVFNLAYANLPTATGVPTPTAFFSFGNRPLFKNGGANPTAVTSKWSDVVYEIGATIP